MSIVGIVDFELFKDREKLLSEFRILDVDDQFEYTDKMRIKVLDSKDSQKERIASIEAIEVLTELVRQAARVQSHDEFEKILDDMNL